MDEQTFEIARQYTQCAFEADEAIAHLIDIVDRCDEDTVVVYFGDHAPTLGANFAGYIASGFAADQKDMLSQKKGCRPMQRRSSYMRISTLTKTTACSLPETATRSLHTTS